MARIRSVKPEFWSDEKLASVCRDARLLFLALLNMSEDHGVARGNPAYVRSQAFPYDEEVTLPMVSGWLTELERVGLIHRFAKDGQSFLFIVNFSKHQKIDRPTKPTLPKPPEGWESFPSAPLDEDSTNARRGLDEDSLLERKGEERRGEEWKGVEAPAAPPPPRVEGLVYEAPQKPEEEWDASDFFRWAQSRRIASGLVGEKWPRPEKLRDFWRAVSLAGVSVHRLKEGFYRFGTDPFWERPDVKPPHPWNAFQSGWPKYVPQQEGASA